MRKHKVNKMLFSSSSSVYGNNTKMPLSESDNVCDPISPYALTKMSCELLCNLYSHLFGFNTTCLRFFTVYGPRQRPDLAIHKFVKLIDQGLPIPFYGDGSTGRDYTFINDIVDGISCAMNNLGGYRLYNLGNSRVISLVSLVNILEELLNKKAIIAKLPRQSGDVEITCADISKAKNEIGYDPKCNFKEGLKIFIEWYSSVKSLINE